jgi:hypothetical protein
MAEERYAVLRQDIASGWVCFTADDPAPPPARVGEFLNIDFMRWLRQNSTFKVRATLPIVANGNTVAIHVWFD